MEEGEECDCGSKEECPCCIRDTCKLAEGNGFLGTFGSVANRNLRPTKN